MNVCRAVGIAGVPAGESATEMPSLHCITLNTGFAFPIITPLAVAQQGLFPEDVRGKKKVFQADIDTQASTL